MRTFFLLLLLANLLFVAWVRWIAPPPAAAGRATPATTVVAGAPELRLLREGTGDVAAPGRDPAAGARALPASSGDALDCVSAGPYVSLPLAEQASARLSRLGFAARLRPAREEIRVGEWVRLQNLATPEDAGNALSVLKAAGLADAYILAEEGAGTVVSLGVFADPARAAETIGIARAAGFEPEVVDRSRQADVFWLDIDRRASAGLPSPEDLRGAAADDAPALELRPCPAVESEAPVDAPPR